MRHRRGIDLIPEKGAIDPDRGIGHLRLADLADDQLLGALLQVRPQPVG